MSQTFQHDMTPFFKMHLNADSTPSKQIVDQLVKDGVITDDKGKQALALTVKNMDKAVAALKTAPAAEDEVEIQAFIKALTAHGAYLLSPSHPHSAAMAEQLKPLFEQFRDACADKYSPEALEKLEKSGKPMKPTEAELGKEALDKLNQICNNPNNVLPMQQLLVDLDRHPILLNALTQGLHRFRQNNRQAFELYLKDFVDKTQQINRDRGAHVAYNKDWEKLGVDLMRFVTFAFEMGLHPITGEVPSYEFEPEQDRASACRPINGKLVPA